MPRITLPDGTVKDFTAPVTAAEVAASIGAGLAKAAIGAKVNGELRDLSTLLTTDCSLSIVTPKKREGGADPDGLFLVRHSAAHVMAEAIQRLFPGAGIPVQKVVRVALFDLLPVGGFDFREGGILRDSEDLVRGERFRFLRRLDGGKLRLGGTLKGQPGDPEAQRLGKRDPGKIRVQEKHSINQPQMITEPDVFDGGKFLEKLNPGCGLPAVAEPGEDLCNQPGIELAEGAGPG